MTTPPPIDDVRRLMLQGIYKDGPDDGDLISLPDLVLQVAEFYGMVGPVSLEKAAGLILAGLLGRDGWADKPTESLDLYHATTSGNVLMRADSLCGCDDAPACGHLSPRLQALNRLPLQVTMGRDLADLGSGPNLNSPAPRYLALVRDEALRAFGVVDAVAIQPATTEQQPEEPWQQRALAMHAAGKKPTAIAKELGIAALLGVEQEAARKRVERLIRKAKKQPIKYHWPGLGGASAAS